MKAEGGSIAAKTLSDKIKHKNEMIKIKLKEKLSELNGKEK
jgi:hypothetical protein